MTEATFRLRGELRLKNARLVEARLELGKSVREMAEIVGIPYSAYCGYETMRLYPGEKHRAVLASWCACSEAELFPYELVGFAENGERVLVSTSEIEPLRLAGSVRREVLALPAPNASEEVEDAVEVQRLLGFMRPRDRRFVALWLGLDGNSEHTYEEIGAQEGILKERVRQIVNRGLAEAKDKVSAKEKHNRLNEIVSKLSERGDANA